MNSDEVIDAGFNDFDDLEVSGGGASPYITTMTLDVGLFLYVTGAPRDRFYSFSRTVGGRKKATEEFKEAFSLTNDDPPKDFQLEPHLEIVFSKDNIINRDAESMPTWKDDARVFHFPMRVSGDRERNEDGWVPHFYENFKPNLDTLKSVLDVDRALDILNVPVWVRFHATRDEWELWQIARVIEGKSNWERYAKMETDEVQWVPVLDNVYQDEEEARSGLTFIVPPNELWSELGDDYGPWSSYFGDIVKAAGDADSADQLTDYLIEKLLGDPEDNERETLNIVTTDHLDAAMEAAAGIPF